MNSDADGSGQANLAISSSVHHITHSTTYDVARNKSHHKNIIHLTTGGNLMKIFMLMIFLRGSIISMVLCTFSMIVSIMDFVYV